MDDHASLIAALSLNDKVLLLTGATDGYVGRPGRRAGRHA